MIPIAQTKALASDYVEFAEKLLIIQDKAQRFVPLRYTRAQKDFLSKRTRRDLVLKARQVMFSTAIQAEFFRLYTTSAQSALTMADKQDNTDKLRRMAELFYHHLPPNIPKPTRSESNAVVTVYPIIGSKVAIATARSETSGRAGTATLFHGSEVAYWANAEDIIKGALQSVPEHLSDTWVVFESTANGQQGWFWQECMKALRGESEWTLHFYAWWWADDYRLPLDKNEVLILNQDELALASKHGLSQEQIKWRRKKIRDLGDSFQQEYPESAEQAFLSSGNGVFRFLHDTFDAPIVKYNPEHQYVMGIDWGQADDFTDARVFDVTTYSEVAVLHLNKLSYESMIDSIAKLAFEWHVEKIMPERNSMGAAIEMLSAALNRLEWPIDPRTKYPSNPTIQSFWTDIRSKDRLVKLFQAGIEAGLKLLDDPIANAELRGYISRQTSTGLWNYTHPEGGHDDTVIARLLAHAATYELKA
jgi:hypothetical protein